MPRGVPRVPEPREWVLMRKCACCGETKPWALFSPQAYWPDGSVRRPAAYCQVCLSRKVAARGREVKRWRDPRVAAYKLDWQRRKREELRRDRMSAGTKNDAVDAAPLKHWLENKLREFELGTISELAGVSVRRLGAVLRDESERVSLQAVDKCLTAFGERLDDLYPMEDAA